MTNNTEAKLSQYQAFISPLIVKHQYRQVVLQIPKQMLSVSFQLTALLRRSHKGANFYVLYDSLKQSCCTDVLGAEHLAYDGLFHFGEACFSTQHQPNHHYILPSEGEQNEIEIIKEMLGNEGRLEQMKKYEIGLILVSQKYYTQVKQCCFQNAKMAEKQIQMMRLPMDARPEDLYIIFGYHANLNQQQQSNILLIADLEEDNQSSLPQRLAVSLESLKNIVGQQLYALNTTSQSIQKITPNTNKLLMQRYSLISQLEHYKTFGIIVSNTATTFHKTTLLRCQSLLIGHNKKVFTFMMNNLNEVKLGNFPEIEVYVIVACFQHSLFGIKDFHRLVVTPNDLESAFAGRPFQSYSFDCASKTQLQQIKGKELPGQVMGEEVEKVQSELTLRDKIQTMDFYREREFKGLDFGEKKEVKKAGKGKVGLAQQYKDLS